MSCHWFILLIDFFCLLSFFLGIASPVLEGEGKALEYSDLSSALGSAVYQINLGPSEPKSPLLLDEDIIQLIDGWLWGLIELMNVKFLAHTEYTSWFCFLFYSMLNIIHIWKKLATLSPFIFCWAPRLNSTSFWILALFLFPSSQSTKLYNTGVQLIL